MAKPPEFATEWTICEDPDEREREREYDEDAAEDEDTTQSGRGAKPRLRKHTGRSG